MLTTNKLHHDNCRWHRPVRFAEASFICVRRVASDGSQGNFPIGEIGGAYTTANGASLRPPQTWLTRTTWQIFGRHFKV